MNNYKDYSKIDLLLAGIIIVFLLYGPFQEFTQEDDCECPTTWDYLVNFYYPDEVTTGEPSEEEISYFGTMMNYLYPDETTTGEPSEEDNMIVKLHNAIYQSEVNTPEPFEQSSFI